MVNLTIDGRPAQVPEGTTILEAARQADIHIPHLCYLKGINEIAACRVCCVEVEGERAMVTACNNPVQEGMAVHTNSPRARSTRRINVELILSQHDCKCATCVRSGNCQLQEIANDLGILELPFEIQLPQGLRKAWTTTFPLFHDYNKCIKCMRCIQVCDKIQSLSIWDVAGTGSRTTIDVSNNRVIKDSDCALCGQCITHCPTGGLRERDDTQRAFAALADPDKITVVQVAPAVRTAWGEAFGLPREQATMGRMAAALRRLGFRYIFDTNFTADLTIMEEGSEFFRRLQRGDMAQYPMFTSCCPGWVRFLKGQYPQLTGQLSTAKSPQQMFGSLTKSWPRSWEWSRRRFSACPSCPAWPKRQRASCPPWPPSTVLTWTWCSPPGSLCACCAPTRLSPPSFRRRAWTTPWVYPPAPVSSSAPPAA